MQNYNSHFDVQYSSPRYMPLMQGKNLPIKLQSVVWQVHGMTQAPLDLIAACSLGAMSLACQDLFDVSPKEKLRFATSLYLMILATSGERKSTVDGILMSPLRELEREWHAEFQEMIQVYEVDKQLWTIEFKELEKKFARAVISGDGIDDCHRAMFDCKRREPIQPVRRRLIISDITKASVKRELGTGSPSLFLYSDEAGSILKGDLLHDTPLMNSLWSGKSIEVDRASGASFLIEDVRVGAMLQIQPELYAEYAERQGRNARYSGFSARTLICHPQSTIGSRLASSAIPNQQADDDALSWFNRRVKELLEQSFERRKHKRDRICLTLSPQAFAMWNQEYLRIESMCGSRGTLKDFHDYASKQLEHISRIAGVLEAFMTGNHIISEQTMYASISIANYFLDSFIQLHTHNNQPEEVEDAFILENWLKENHFRVGYQHFQKNIIRKYGPNRLRDKVRLERALSLLQAKGVVCCSKVGRKNIVAYCCSFSSLLNV